MKKIKIGNKELSGVETRTIFGLKSANFSFEIKEYKNEKGYLIDTCLNAQDQYVKMIEYYLK